jgi:hypothetical protein
MISPNSLKQLSPNKSHWNYPRTITLRIPENIKDKVLDYAKKLDNESLDSNPYNSTVTLEELRLILSKINNKESGYKANSASKLISELKQLLMRLENVNQ